MKVFNYSQLKKSGNETFDILNALRLCKKKKYGKIVFPKSNYFIDSVFCEQRNLNISNHGLNGPKRIAFLIENFKNFEIDFGGSTVLFKDAIIPLAILSGKNISVKNLTIENPEANIMDLKVVATGENCVKLEILNGKGNFFIENGKLWAAYGREYQYIKQDVVMEINGETGEIEYGTGDNALGDGNKLYYELIDDNHILVQNVTRMPKVGNVIVTNAYCRCAAGVFIDKSENVYFENVIVHSCLGMGLLAQFSKDIALNSFNTLKKEGFYHTAGADATHFVSCKGLIKVENCTFEGQLDDALNIHGIFVKVIEKLSSNELMLKEMHCQATGLPVIEVGDVVSVVDNSSILPYSTKRVVKVEYVNDEILLVRFNESVEEVKVGDNIENLTKVCDLTFRNNVVQNNRARGILVSAKGKVLIENNRFHTAGAAILFESEDKWWFESGSTTDVTVKGNLFDKCKYGKWGNAVIEFVKREKAIAGRYYHDEVKVLNNEFKLYSDSVALFDNIKSVQFIENAIEGGQASVTLTHCGDYNIQSENVDINLR